MGSNSQRARDKVLPVISSSPLTEVVETGQRWEVLDPTLLDPVDDRCIPSRLGCPSRGTSSSRILEPSRAFDVIQSERTQSNPDGSLSFFPPYQKQGCKGSLRQFYCGILHQQTGRHQVSESTLRSRSNSVLGRAESFPPFSSPHSGVPECGCRPAQQRSPSSGRNVSESGDLSSDHSPVGSPGHRSHGDKIQCQSGNVLFPVSGGQSLGSRCSVNSMGVQAGLHLSSHRHDTQGIDEDSAGPSLSNSRDSILAQEVLVYPAHADEPRAILEASPNAEPGVPGHSALPGSIQTQSDSLEIDESLLEPEGLSAAVLRTMSHSRAPATVKAYARVKRIFLLWCASHQVPSQDPPVSAILQFMQDGLDKGLSPSTLKVQISALSAAFGRSLHQDPLIKRFLKGAVRLKPSISRPIPQWDLSVVLKGLSGPPFEPLEEVDFKFLSWKVTFLLAVTSAKRISELQAFSAYEPYTLFLPDRVLLRFLPTFLPKVPSVHNINQVVSLPVLCSSSSSAEETSLHTLDVARCLRIYIERSREFRRSENLLILFFGRNKGKKASKPTLSRWIREAIRESFASQNRPPPAFVTAHSTRAVSTSWAERSLIPLEQICSAASWSSHSTFVSHYRLNLRGSEDTAFGRSVLNSIQH
ncbi:uncharacterized protein LOC122933245 isoform X1 [Bufo gargarizans]|uniref:uncharacterized protein LOC122920412 isoform X1 n=1 Tax=Bufo gargarizans TaxID=30331 RepID=UPI001CF4D7AD|nr:uncharacterized protein LOC122920412 isoform X1 [Bufo gargarizans]XP_044144044.1 uncharacterized protein LOC122933245 isoform X1 [Bufo gargarizans]